MFWRGGGSVVVHVGELPLSPLAVGYNVNTSVHCQKVLEEKFVCKRRLALPSKPLMKDALTVSRRK